MGRKWDSKTFIFVNIFWIFFFGLFKSEFLDFKNRFFGFWKCIFSLNFEDRSMRFVLFDAESDSLQNFWFKVLFFFYFQFFFFFFNFFFKNLAKIRRFSGSSNKTIADKCMKFSHNIFNALFYRFRPEKIFFLNFDFFMRRSP